MTHYCTICNVSVAPHDPEKIVRDGQIFHKGCWEQKLNCRLRAPFFEARQLWLRFVQ